MCDVDSNSRMPARRDGTRRLMFSVERRRARLNELGSEVLDGNRVGPWERQSNPNPEAPKRRHLKLLEAFAFSHKIDEPLSARACSKRTHCKPGPAPLRR